MLSRGLTLGGLPEMADATSPDVPRSAVQPSAPFHAYLMGPEPVLHADVTGTRAYLVGAGRLTGLSRGIYVHTVEVF